MQDKPQIERDERLGIRLIISIFIATFLLPAAMMAYVAYWNAENIREYIQNESELLANYYENWNKTRLDRELRAQVNKIDSRRFFELEKLYKEAQHYLSKMEETATQIRSESTKTSEIIDKLTSLHICKNSCMKVHASEHNDGMKCSHTLFALSTDGSLLASSRFKGLKGSFVPAVPSGKGLESMADILSSYSQGRIRVSWKTSSDPGYYELGIIKWNGDLGAYLGATLDPRPYLENAKQGICDILNSIDTSEYFFVYELSEDKGFARMIVNPNRPDLIGKMVDETVADSKGFQYRKAFMEGIRRDGEAWVTYQYKKPGEEGESYEKTSKFILYPPFNWIVAKGYYYDELHASINAMKSEFEEEYTRESNRFYMAFVLVLLVFFSIAVVLTVATQRLFSKYKNQTRESMNALQLSEARLKEEHGRLEESEQRHRELFNGNEAVMLIVDSEDGSILDVNPAGLRFYGWSLEQMKQMNISALNTLPPEVVAEMIKRAGKLNQNRFQFRHRTASGPIRDVDVFSSPVELNGRKCLFSIIYDSTDRKNFETELRESRMRLSMALAGTNCGLWDWNIKSGDVYFNEQWFTMLGYQPGELPGRIETWELLAHPDDLDKVRPVLEAHLRGETESYDSEHRMRAKNGEWRWIHDRGKVTERDSDGKAIRAVGTHIDITDRKLYEKSLSESESRLQEANRTKDRFFSIIAHDLRNPFSGILGMTELLLHDRNEMSSENLDISFKLLHGAAQKGVNLLEDLLQWARSQGGSLKVEPEMLKVKECLLPVLAVTKDSAEKKSIQINLTTGGEVVFADEKMLQTVVRNLISNAIKFTPARGKVDISASKLNDEIVRISVKDTGVGISPEDIEKIFRIDESFTTPGTAGEAGTGLGLILVREFVEKNNGSLKVESRIGEGTCIHVDLPAGPGGETITENLRFG